jgi:CCR4-NOT transcriptional complex subunit CAF120
MEGWARIRVAGQRDWKKVWMVVQEGSGDHANDQHHAPATNGSASASPPVVIRKRRVSNIFHSSSPSTPNSSSSTSLPSGPFVTIYTSPKPKHRKSPPLLIISNVTQVYAVYPERPELISKSTLMKIEGFLDDGDMAGLWRGKEGWAFLMPESENGRDKQPLAGQGGGQVAEMLKWIVALHDAFKLYGRPEAWTWDPRDPVSLMYGYPVGRMKEVCCLIF